MKVDVLLENGKIIIKKVSGKKHLTTKERLMEFYGKTTKKIPKSAKTQNEVDWGKPVGEEVWLGLIAKSP